MIESFTAVRNSQFFSARVASGAPKMTDMKMQYTKLTLLPPASMYYIFVLQFHVLSFGPSFSCSAILTVRHFRVRLIRHFQATRRFSHLDQNQNKRSVSEQFLNINISVTVMVSVKKASVFAIAPSCMALLG